MNSGMLWFDDDPRKSLETKIAQAAARFSEKHGRRPTTCCVSPSVAGMPQALAGIRVIALARIRPNYLWLGLDDEGQAAEDGGQRGRARQAS
jgi:hypothetical protein